MDFERIWNQIKRIKAWYKTGDLSGRGEDREILKPLNRIIDFERQECILENNFIF